MKTTEQIRTKKYRCQECGHEKLIETNHYGQCYSWGSFNASVCPPFKRPTTWVCAEPVPTGMGTPEPWAKVKLGDIVTITEVKP